MKKMNRIIVLNLWPCTPESLGQDIELALQHGNFVCCAFISSESASLKLTATEVAIIH